MTAPLSVRRLGRATLARQLLLRRESRPAVETVGELVGLQAQNAWSPYVALWSRLEGFRHAELSDALEDRRLARIAVMRGTIHLVTAADAVLLPALTAPLFLRALATHGEHGAALRALDLPAVAQAARRLVEEQPRVTTDLGTLLAQQWPGVAPGALAQAARGTLPLVQVPPRGLWGRSGATTWTTADHWLPDASAAAPDVSDPRERAAQLDRLVLRYLAAFGPAATTDVQRWSGLTGLRAVRDRLVADGRAVPLLAAPGPGRARPYEVLDVPGAPLPDEDVPAPVRFLPDYDNLLLAHADRSRFVDEEHRRALSAPNGVVPGTVLVDGRVAATWSTAVRREGPGRLATVTVTPLVPLAAGERRALLDEAEAFVRFREDAADDHAVVLDA
ncbi:winged helix DNA-binding domain-containing protein [Cellulomonas massiliensis]|uniref:winged helix DNA-binding domain-containing protein n=1 Tax=Cellulomonas massiliensis TaxID=1465811 RepID=UPI00031067AE|nr:winged helix DNA-binding domain-containing protein [Cellulomonas massiliensis]